MQDLIKIFVTTLILSFLLLYFYLKKCFNYWKSRNVPHLEVKIPFGNVEPPFFRKKHNFQALCEPYNYFKSRGEKYFGFYLTVAPNFVPINLEITKDIMTRDFEHFIDRGMYCNEKADPLTVHLFAVDETKWKGLRTKMTPTFTSGKMKMMFPTLVECSEKLETAVEKMNNEQGKVEIKEILACFTTDVIGSCIFGLELNAIADKNTPFRKYGKRVLQANFWDALRYFFNFNCTTFAKAINNHHFPKDVVKFFIESVKETIEYRERTGFSRKDFLQLLMELKNSKEGIDFTMGTLTAQAFIFFVAGFETSSTAMSFFLYECCLNNSIQKKVREEIETVLKTHSGEITYDGIKEMTYLNQVFDETLRKYPSVPVLTRKCTKNYKVRDSDLVIEKGVSVIIPIYSYHHDPDYFPDPEKFDPDRFSPENREKIVPYSYMPFGEGPRNCIGLRFGKMQALVGLVMLLKNYEFCLESKIEPLIFNPNIIVMQTIGTMYLKVKRVEK